MTKIKICGITNIEDAKIAERLRIEEIGFNFYPGSKRFIETADAVSIAERLEPEMMKVGVFVDHPFDQIIEIAGMVGLNAIQLHGSESSQMVREIRSKSGLMVIKAIRVSAEMNVGEGIDNVADAVLLDSYSATEAGGTGETFDWTIAKEIVLWRPESVYLAGGLSVENVADAVKSVRPYAIDACSRLESSPGKKDKDKLARFVFAARAAK